MIPAESIDRARLVDALEAARRYVVLKRVAANEWAGPCPDCGGDDRFAVNTRKQIFNCRGCGAKGGVIDLVMLALGVGFAQAVEELVGASSSLESPRRPKTAPCKPETDEEETARKSRLALAIFDGAGSIRQPRAELARRYLVQVRGVDIDQIPEIDGVLRFEPDCPFDADRLPCLIALVRDIVTDAPKAIQRTALGPDGRKIDRRSLGPTRGAAVKLWEDAAVTYGLVIGEGLETVAAAATRIERRGTLLQPAWALIDRINLRDFPVLAGIEALTILVDHDESGDGQKAASVCTRRWFDAQREVIRLTPKTLGTDFDDIVRGEGA
jgi:hypothetical protein